MCGIVGYLGSQEAYPILIDGLKRLEYRGYDSAGVATLEPGGAMRIEKKKGKVANLEAHVGENRPVGTVGIGHTRWATHGPPCDVNAHPHAGGSGRIALIHNGIIENYEALRELLTHRGHNLVSETDTEVLAHFIEEVQTTTGLDLPDAVRTALKEVVGAYAIVVVDQHHPDRLIAARKSSPLVIGVGENNEFFVGSDATPIVAYTKNVIYLEDEESSQSAPLATRRSPRKFTPSSWKWRRLKKPVTTTSCSKKFSSSPNQFATPSAAAFDCRPEKL